MPWNEERFYIGLLNTVHIPRICCNISPQFGNYAACIYRKQASRQAALFKAPVCLCAQTRDFVSCFGKCLCAAMLIGGNR